MLRKLLDFSRRALRPLAVAALLAGLSGSGTRAQGISDTAPVQQAPAKEPTPPAVTAQSAVAAPAGRDLSEWALATAVLSLVGVAYLILRPKPRRRSSASGAAGSPVSQAAALPNALSPGQHDQVHRMIERALAEQAKAATGPTAPAHSLPKAATNKSVTRPAAPPAVPPAPAAPLVPVAAASNEEFEAFLEPAVSVPPASAGPRRVYVSSAPVNGRFRRNALQDQPAHNSIYELTRDPAQPDQATFRVNPDVASHPRHISSYADVLEPACEFNLPQGAASRIVTEAPGLLRRVDGDDWEIVRKARIHFA
ncbi:hypothetical protein ACFQ48_13710 [Hymenobacter caeli]|uniref:Uncharacterized protein n=1 Tax=Hymenobacter caeli TaxID=2735894 RepID=A0ABX2FV75_9BACT|nr:hypothetical protein [Hymenobacter caeli]NRT20327.1 hypothetical protein [Hymenobacter caeli]